MDFGTCYNGCITEFKIFDPIGTCVDRCARISKKATENSIVFSSDFFEILKQDNSKFISNLEEGDELMKGLGMVKYYKLYSS